MRARYRSYTYDAGEASPVLAKGQKRYLFSSTAAPARNGPHYSRFDAALSLSLYGHTAEAQAVLLSLIEKQQLNDGDAGNSDADSMEVDNSTSAAATQVSAVAGADKKGGGKSKALPVSSLDKTLWQRCWLDATKTLGQWGQLRLYAHHAQDRYLHMEASAALGDPRGHAFAFRQTDPLRGGVQTGHYPLENKLCDT